MSKLTPEQNKQIEAEVMDETTAALERAGVTVDHIATRLREAMDAKRGKRVEHSIRLDALKFAATLRNMKPAERYDLKHSGEVGLTINLIDKFGE